MADVLLVVRSRRNRRRRDARISWRLRDIEDPFQMSDHDFCTRFRLSKDAVKLLIREIRPFINIALNGYSIEMQVLTTLSIFGGGTFQRIIADNIWTHVSQASASRFFRKVTDAINLIAKKFVSFPTIPGDVFEVCNGFYDKFGFPNIIGAIDGTHIDICRPNRQDFFVYINRHGKYSINVQMACDSRMRIMDVVAMWPGCTHDAYIWRYSGLKMLFSSGRIPPKRFLLGDSGYPLEQWLLTPYQRPTSPPEITYNRKHRSTRNVIERCFGVLKSRFRILHQTGGTLLYKSERVCEVITAAAVLHNICILTNMPEMDGNVLISDDNDDDDDDNDGNNNSIPYIAAQRMRDEIAARFQAAR